MTSYIELDGQRVTEGRITIPYYGIMMADLKMALPDTVPTSTTLTVGNLVMKCTVFRQAPFAGTLSARIVGGAAGWRKQISAQSYYAANGVKISTLIRDAASSVGETATIASSVDGVIGSSWTREAGPARRVLRQLAGEEWWVDVDGITQIGPRTGKPVKSNFSAVHWSGGKGWFEIATEDPASWMPGNTFSTTLIPSMTISMTEITADNQGKLRLSVLSTT